MATESQVTANVKLSEDEKMGISYPLTYRLIVKIQN